jgi:DNA-binding CsgD family transcriptional regulator
MSRGVAVDTMERSVSLSDGPALRAPHAAVLAEASYAAGSRAGSAEVAREMLDVIRSLTRHDAAAMHAWDPTLGHHHVLCVDGYDEATVEELGDRFAATDTFRRLLQWRIPLRIDDPPYDYRKTQFFLEVTRPSGFDEGMSVCLVLPDGTYTGMLHLSAESSLVFDDSARDLVAALAPIAARVTNLHTPVVPAAEVGEDFCGVLVDAGGNLRAVHGRPASALLHNDEVIAAVAAAFLRGHRPSMRGLRTSPEGWHEIQLRRVADPIPGRPDAAFVVERPCEAPYRLSVREVDVLTALADGSSNPQIAARFVISPRTVTTHVERILEKLGCESRAGAAAKAVCEGLLRIDLLDSSA